MKTNDDLKSAINAVKLAKADKAYWDAVKTYGRESAALRAFDCIDRNEAITMLAVVQPISIFKLDGKVVVQ